ncbi:MAG: HPF/RaiA family ribosome-associated protein [Methylococcales bacterium]
MPLQVTFRGLPPSEAVEQNIREKVEKLEQTYDKIIACKVVVDSEHHHKHQGNLYHVRIELKVPKKEIVVSREHHENHAHEDVYVVIRDAFNAARRQLEDHTRVGRQSIKNQENDRVFDKDNVN